MSYEVRELTSAQSFATIATAQSFEAAKAYVSEDFKVVSLEDDADFPGCADAFTASGRVLAIQPAGFRA